VTPRAVVLALGVVGCAADPLCDDAPTLTWANHGEAFFVASCQGCHASTARNRYGAPADVVFDTEADVARRRDAIERAVFDRAPEMPPGGGLTEEELASLRVFLACGLDGA
jgi:mono/diheme cytochrome c family protein